MHSDGEKRRWCSYGGMTLREVNEPKPMFPRLERRHAEMFAYTELSDRQPAVKLTTNAFALERMALEVGCSRHRVAPEKGRIGPLRRLPDPARMVISDAYGSSATFGISNSG